MYKVHHIVFKTVPVILRGKSLLSSCGLSNEWLATALPGILVKVSVSRK